MNEALKRSRILRLGSLAVVAAVALAARTAPADAHVYWSTPLGGSIGRANLDGTGVDPNFITRARHPQNLAVAGAHLYWANNVGSIGRSNLDGSGPDPGFLPARYPFGLAADAHHIYWVDLMTDTIARANLDGTGVDLNFIAGRGNVEGLAIDGEHIYWGRILTGPDSIARADLDGSDVEPDFITGANVPRAIAVNRDHVYWANLGAKAIGRARLDGSGVDQRLITDTIVSDGLAADDRHVYWTDGGARAIGRANVDGSGVDHQFIATAAAPRGVAVDGGPAGSALASSGSLTFGAQAIGTLAAAETLTITNEGHGNLELDAARIIGPHAGDFLVGDDGCSGSSLPIGETCTLRVQFRPTASGPREATLAVASNERGSPLQIALRGSGSKPAQAPAPATSVAGAPASVAAAPLAGAPARTRPAAPPRLVICRKVAQRRRCATRTVAGAPLPTLAGARASLRRRGLVYATGTARRGRVVLDARRRVPAGRYSLRLRFRREGRQATARLLLDIR
jgi:hypothetical protein